SRLRDSSRAGGWRGVNRGWGPIRCTWGNNKPDRTKTQQKIIQLHGYRSRPISRNLAEISIAYVIGKREAAAKRRGRRICPLCRVERRALRPDQDASRSFPLSTFATHCSSLMRSSWMGVLLGTDAQEVGGFFLDVCRPCGDCEGEVGREGGRDGVFGDGGEVVKQGVEAVDGETIVGSAGGLLGEGGGRSLSLCDRALAERLGGLLVGVV